MNPNPVSSEMNFHLAPFPGDKASWLGFGASERNEASELMHACWVRGLTIAWKQKKEAMNKISCQFLLSAAMTLSLGAPAAMAAASAVGDPSFESVASLKPEGRPRYEEVGIKEHPLATKLRYGVLGMEDVEVGGTGGRQVIPLVGDPFLHLEKLPDLATSLSGGFLPIITYSGSYQGILYKEEIFSSLLECSEVVDGTEVMVNFVKLTAKNISTTPKPATVTVVFAQGGGAIGEAMPIDDGAAKSGFYSNFGTVNEANWEAGTAFQNGVRVVFSIPPGEERDIIMKIPREGIAYQSYKAKIKQLDYERAKEAVTLKWENILARGTRFIVPEKRVEDMYRAHLAYIFMNVNRLNKSNNRTGWNPHKVYDYVHLCPATYEALWPFEIDHILNYLDQIGYSREVENYLEVFFALQGTGPYTLSSAPIPGLPPTNYVGTTAFRWMDETGCVLHAIGEHYRYTHNKSWLFQHSDSVEKACEWVNAALAVGPGGLLPEGGLAIDGAYRGQAYFSDFTTWTGLESAADALTEAGIEGGKRWVERAEKYRSDILRSVDKAILPVDEFRTSSELGKYDFSLALPAPWLGVNNATEDKNGNGVPVWLDNGGQSGILSREEAVKRGIVGYFPIGPELRIPFTGNDYGYNFNLIFPAFAFSTGLVDGSSTEPLFPGARYSGSSLAGLYLGYEEAILPKVGPYFSPPPYYGYHLAISYLQRDEIEKVLWIFYGLMADNMSRTTYAASEELTGPRCPASHTMAYVDELLRMMLVREDSFQNRLIFASAVPRAWLEDGKTIKVDRAMTCYGAVSYTIVSKVDSNRIEATVSPPSGTMPNEIVLRLRHPNEKTIRSVSINGADYSHFGAESITLSGSLLKEGPLSLIVEY
jgi:hypothetical protein